jgi:DNA-binding transcriptional LysR family regulator
MAGRIDWDHHIGRHLRLRDLHAFFTVVRSGSMAKAAVELRVSQPAVSKVIADLESALSVRLFDRSSKGIEPTVYGRALLKRGVAAFDELKQAIRDIEFLSDPARGELNIACPGSIARSLAPRMVERFMEAYPSIVMRVDAVANPQLFPGLHDRTYDVYLTLLPLPERRVPEGLDIEFLFSDLLVIAAQAHHRLAKRRKVEFADLAAESWVLPRPDSWNYICIADAFRARGLGAPKIALWSNDAPVRNQMIATGRFVTTVSRSTADWYGMKVLPVDLPAKAWPVVIATVKDRTLSPVVELFIQFARDFTKSMRAPGERPIGTRRGPANKADQGRGPR